MTFEEIKVSIGKKLSDPLLQEYRGLIKDYFKSVMTTMLTNPEVYNLEEIPELVGYKQEEIHFQSGFYDYDMSQIDRVLDVNSLTLNPSNNYGKRYLIREITKDMLNDYIQNDLLLPVDGELIYCKDGKKLKMITGNQVQTLRVSITYIMNPNFDSWLLQDLVTDLKYSERFLMVCIDETARRIKENEIKRTIQ
ncbi:MAG: hypothetical protein H8D45_11065 [Bacteroidetes bacterium]|nr:hypothetical protein [Bacteroidota bacterium]